MKKLLFMIASMAALLNFSACTPEEETLEVRKIYVEPESVVVGVGQTVTIVPTALPDKITDAVFEWRSDNEAVATVDAGGTVTGVSKGETVVHVSSGAVTVDVPVTVYLPLTDILIEPDSESLELYIRDGVAETVELTITKVPADAEEAIVCESSDNSVVTITNDGLVTPVGEGSATLTVRGESGEISKTIGVTVTATGAAAELITVPEPWFLYTVEGDNCQDMNDAWPMKNIFDGNREQAGGTSPTEIGSPQSFTVDLGKIYKVSYLHLFTWQGVYTDGPQYHPFGEKNIKYMEVYGSATLDETGDWSKWTKLMDCQVTKPSGLPNGEFNDADMQACADGQIFFTENYDLPVRYLRVRINETWDGTWGWRCCEMEFYGQEVSE